MSNIDGNNPTSEWGALPWCLHKHFKLSAHMKIGNYESSHNPTCQTNVSDDNPTSKETPPHLQQGASRDVINAFQQREKPRFLNSLMPNQIRRLSVHTKHYNLWSCYKICSRNSARRKSGANPRSSSDALHERNAITALRSRKTRITPHRPCRTLLQ